MVLLRGFIQTVKEEFTPILHNLSHRIEEEGILSNSFYDMSIILVPKPGKESSKKKKKKYKKAVCKISYELICKNLQQNFSKSNPTLYQKNYRP